MRRHIPSYSVPRGLWPEPGVRVTAGRRRGRGSELDRLCRFAGAVRVVYADGLGYL